MTVSIVVICQDNPDELRRTLDSVARQRSSYCELVIVDGSLKGNGCQRVSEEMGYGTAHRREADQGIYDGMNKGLERCTGASVLFLNSGDILHPTFDLDGAVARWRSALREKVIVGGGSFYFRERRFQYENRRDLIHQAVLFPRTFYRTNRYREDFRFAADVEYIERALSSCEAIYVDDLIAECQLGGRTTRPSGVNDVLAHLSEALEVGQITTIAESAGFLVKQLTFLLVIKIIGFETALLTKLRFKRGWREIA